MCFLELEPITDSFAHNTWKTTTPPTATDEEGKPAEPVTTIPRFLLILLLLINKFLTYENKGFSVDGSEYYAVVYFLLFM